MFVMPVSTRAALALTSYKAVALEHCGCNPCNSTSHRFGQLQGMALHPPLPAQPLPTSLTFSVLAAQGWTGIRNVPMDQKLCHLLVQDVVARPSTSCADRPVEINAARLCWLKRRFSANQSTQSKIDPTVSCRDESYMSCHSLEVNSPQQNNSGWPNSTSMVLVQV